MAFLREVLKGYFVGICAIAVVVQTCASHYTKEADVFLGAPKGTILTGHVYCQIRGKSRLYCGVVCLKNAAVCRSLNYCSSTKLCELNDANSTEYSQDMKTSEGCDYYDIIIDPDECASSPCFNNGQCVDGDNSYTCNCDVGYTGDQCQIDIDECASMPCINNGLCVDRVNSYSCDCAVGYSGSQCQIDIDECASGPCENEGACSDAVNSYTCNCANGYNGLTCQNNINECASSPCLNNGLCVDRVNSYSCDCAVGYSGSQCQIDIDECASGPCKNGGACNDAVNSYTCNCANGYNGLTCQNNINECASSPCLNNGQCVDGVNSYSCDCAVGYSGSQCQIDPCTPNQCQNGGICQPEGASFFCDCAQHFQGDLCETPVNPCDSNPCQSGKVCQPLNAPDYTGYNCKTAASCQEVKAAGATGSSIVTIQTPCQPTPAPRQVWCNQDVDNGGWMRLHTAKTGTCGWSEWTEEILHCPSYGHRITGIRVADGVSQSWVLGADSCGSLSFDNLDFFIEVNNCGTPSRSGWTWGDTGVLISATCSLSGTSWPGTVSGSCGSSVAVRVSVDFSTSFRTFIMSCNGGGTWYEIDRWDTNNVDTREFWIRN